MPAMELTPNDPGETVEGQVLLEERDYVAANLAEGKDSVRQIRKLLGIVLVITALAVVAFWPVGPGVWCLMALACAVAAVTLPRQREAAGRRAFAMLHPSRREVRYTLRAEGYERTSPTAEVWASWQALTHWVETEEAFLLRGTAGLVDFWPKRAFDGAALERVREVLTERVKAAPAAEPPKKQTTKTVLLWLLLVALFGLAYSAIVARG
jgi:hypothetical protein